MDAREWTTYREPAASKARVFELGSSGIAGRAYLTTVTSLVLTVAFYVLSDGRGFVILCAPVVGAALTWLCRYGPRAVEVGADAVVVHSHHRAARRIEASELTVHVLPGELVLLGPAMSIEIAADRFPERSLAACAEAAREIAARASKPPLEPSTET